MEYLKIFNEMLTVSSTDEVYLSNEHKTALRNMTKCRTYSLGGRVVYCPTCKTHTVLYNPCNQRGCPTCYERRQIVWKERLQNKLLPIGHYHLTISIPEIYQNIWMTEKRAISKTLFKCAQIAFKQLEKDTEIMYGLIMVFHTHGRGLSYKPHLHCIITPGGIDKNKQWIRNNSIGYNNLRDIIMHHFNSQLLKNINNENHIANIRTKDRDWRIYPVFHKESGDTIVNYLSKSISGVVLDMKQNFEINDIKNTITFEEYHSKEMIKTTLTKDIFLKRYLNHIPPKGEVTIRSYGLYSNKRKKDLELIRQQLENVENQEQQPEKKIINYCKKCKTELIIIEIFNAGDRPKCFTAEQLRAPPKHEEIIIINTKGSRPAA